MMPLSDLTSLNPTSVCRCWRPLPLRARSFAPRPRAETTERRAGTAVGRTRSNISPKSGVWSQPLWCRRCFSSVPSWAVSSFLSASSRRVVRMWRFTVQSHIGNATSRNRLALTKIRFEWYVILITLLRLTMEIIFNICFFECSKWSFFQPENV